MPDYDDWFCTKTTINKVGPPHLPTSCLLLIQSFITQPFPPNSLWIQVWVQKLRFVWVGRNVEGGNFYGQVIREKNSGGICTNMWASLMQSSRGVGSNVNFFQMKTRPHPYWLWSLCGARKINSHSPMPGQGFDANSVRQLEPKG